jgi:uncharacterized protein involved in exopolysaccharide biosynthesis
VNSDTGSRTTEEADVRPYAFRVYPIDDSGELHLSDLWHTLWAGRWWLLGACVLCLVAAVAVTPLITPRFRAQTILAAVTQESGSSGSLAALAGQLGGIAALAGASLGSQNTTAESIATLTSRAFTTEFIQRHDLLPLLFADDWNEATKSWDVDDPSDVPTVWKAYERFDKSVRTVEQDAQTGLITLTIDWTDAQVAALWANEMVSELNEALRHKAAEQSHRNVEYLTEALKETGAVELRTSLFGLMEGEMKKEMLANVAAEYAFKTIDPAVAAERAFWPNRILFAVLGLAFGFFLGLTITFLRHPVPVRA